MGGEHKMQGWLSKFNFGGSSNEEMSLEDFRDTYVTRVLDLLDRDVDMAAGTLGLSAENLRGWRDHE